ncbi:MAG: membrane protein insertase YidC [Desulfobacterales bacterium CG23_combo_of_CG06-09_8_20_14_all_51_8]|nr:MAG: membrane protein insertase YidC [Desulfobacterales bacterium CG23_combo_of_CG06-09_8_20_14_all_51_8]
MEQGRLFLAIALSFLVFIAWEFLFVDKQAPPPLVPSEKAVETIVGENASPAPEESPASEPAEILERPSTPGVFFKAIDIVTPLYTARISEKGAAIVSFVLNDYRQGVDANSPKKELISENNSSGTLLLGFTNKAVPGIADAVFTTDLSGDALAVTDASRSVSFFWRSDEGILIEKRLSFYPDTYKIKMEVILTNASTRALEEDLTVSMMNSGPDDKRQFLFEGPFALVDNKLQEVNLKDIDKNNTISGNIEWAGIGDHYFMSVIISEISSSAKVFLNYKKDVNLLKVDYIQPESKLSPGAKRQFDFAVYLGPKRMSVLKSTGSNLEKAIDFGFFDIIAKPCLWLMNFVHDHLIANYGIAIILLTILFKIIFWPLGTKSYKSMAEMKRLQPLMNEIRQKHKNDKKKMNEEIMGLYRTYKVNPMSGCLPMLVQIPVFFAFYRMLYGAIELRHAPFWGWINDLSAPDRLFSFNFSIPLMTPPYGIPVLTIIMGATMFLQQKLSPPPGDPSQAKIMMMLPLIFTFIFINFPAGLVLYWLVNNVLSISQQYYITRKNA